MKTIKVSLVAAFSAMLMMTSCLSDGGSNTVSGPGFGVVKTLSNGYPALYFTDYDYPVTSTSFINSIGLFSGDQYVEYYITIDYDDEANQNVASKGYITATIQYAEITNIGNVNVKEINQEEPISEYEIALASVEPKSFVQNTAFIAPIISNYHKDNKYRFTVEIDPNPVVDKENNSSHIYDIYLRAERTEQASTSSTSTMGLAYAFPLNSYAKSILDNIRNEEKKESGDGFALRVNYVKEINEETNELKWEKISTLLFVYCPQEK